MDQKLHLKKSKQDYKKRLKRQNIWKYVRKIIFGDTVYKKFFRIYFLTIFIGTIFLYSPFVLNPGWVYENNHYVWYSDGKVFQTYSYFDSIFFASSAFSDTGLVTKTTSDIFNIGGQAIILILIQVGGFGLLAIIILLWQFLTGRNKLSFEERELLHSERGNNKIGQSYKVIYFAFLVIFIVELVGWLVLSFFFYHVKPTVPVNESQIIKPIFQTYDATDYYHNLPMAIWAGFFHIISAANNAGFDILGSTSIQPFHNGLGNILSVVLLLALIFGGIGYPVFYDIYSYFKAKKKRKYYRISLFTKISVISYVLVAVFGLVLILALELPERSGINQIYYMDNQQMAQLHDLQSLTKTEVYGWNSNGDKIWNLIFVSFSARSAGFAPLMMDHLSIEARWLVSMLMFIGASPASTGGGVRTVTLFIIFAFIFTRAMGRKYVSVFKKTIHRNLISESFLTFILGLILVFVTAIIVSTTTNRPVDSNNVFFEAISAFGTSGLTSGVTQAAGVAGLIFLIILMFIGQLGVGATLLTWTKKHPSKALIRYQYEDLRVS